MTVEFNNLYWLICEVGEDHPSMDGGDGIEILGTIRNTRQVIYINKELLPQLFYETLIHEMTHAALFSYGWRDRDYAEEDLCNFMAAHGKEIISQADEYCRKNGIQTVNDDETLKFAEGRRECLKK